MAAPREDVVLFSSFAPGGARTHPDHARGRRRTPSPRSRVMIKDHAFVELALRKNAIDADRLQQALATQKELERFGIRKFVGTILVDKNLAAKETIRELAEELAQFWIRCAACKEPRCLGECDRYGDLKCLACEKSIAYPEGRIAKEDLDISIAPRGGRRRAEAPKTAPPHRHEASRIGRAAAPEPGHEPRAGETPRKPARAVKAATADSDSWFQPEPALREITKYHPERSVGASAAGRLYAITNGEVGALKILDRFLCHDKVRVKEWVEYTQLVDDVPPAATPRPVQLCREGTATYI